MRHDVEQKLEDKRKKYSHRFPVFACQMYAIDFFYTLQKFFMKTSEEFTAHNLRDICKLLSKFFFFFRRKKASREEV